MAGWLEERKQKRFCQEILAENEISARFYNATIGGIVLYGILVNIGIIWAFGEKMAYMSSSSMLGVFIAYVICCFTGIMISSKSDSAIISFLGYNLVVVPVGFVISGALYVYLQFDSGIVFRAFILTALISGFMVAFSVYKPDLFERMGGVLLGCLGGLVIAGLASWIFPGLRMNETFQTLEAWAGAAIFSLYVGYDFHKSQAYPKTLDNAVDSALDSYLDLINLFLRILQILASSSGSNDNRSGRR